MKLLTNKQKALNAIRHMPRHEAIEWLEVYGCAVNPSEDDKMVRSRISAAVTEGVIPADTLLPDDFGRW